MTSEVYQEDCSALIEANAMIGFISSKDIVETVRAHKVPCVVCRRREIYGPCRLEMLVLSCEKQGMRLG